MNRRQFLLGSAAAIAAPAIPKIAQGPLPPGEYFGVIVSVDIEAVPGKMLIRTGIPMPVWRLLNKGVPPEAPARILEFALKSEGGYKYE